MRVHPLLVASLALASCANQSTPLAASPFEDIPGAPTLALPAGKVKGTGADILAFRGIPYARPPVGALRWRAPVAATPWAGTLDATAYGLQCIQAGAAAMSEDCLFVNVWAPRSALSARDRSPVLVWVHGGSFHQGNGSDLQFWLGARGIARVYTGLGMPVYRYLFTRRRNGGSGVAAQHADDRHYVFGNPSLAAAPYQAADVSLSQAMADAWVRFAATGNPNGGRIKDWPRYDLANEPVYQLDATFLVTQGPRNAQLDFMQRFDAASRAR